MSLRKALIRTEYRDVVPSWFWFAIFAAVSLAAVLSFLRTGEASEFYILPLTAGSYFCRNMKLWAFFIIGPILGTIFLFLFIVILSIIQTLLERNIL